MNTQTIYVANDGTRFDSEAACLKYEAICRRVLQAVAPLGPARDVPSRSFWQHDAADVARAWSALYEICKEEFGNIVEWIHITPASEVHPASYLGRVLSEDGRKCLSDAGYRFHCIDPEGREFDQPHWAYYRGEKTLVGHKRMNP